MRPVIPAIFTATLLAALVAAPSRAAAAVHVLPRPASVEAASCAHPGFPRTVAADFDPGALEIINERWRALGIAPLTRSRKPDVVVRRASMGAQAYRLTVRGAAVEIRAGDPDGAFYAATTLAQLPAHGVMPCVHIVDRPALRWRVLSDDVSRGPLPTMRYFKERIRTIAAFKMNGYSPYMEHVFVDPHDPLPAPLDGITPAQLRELSRYAARFHVTFIPEQQTFAHMHNTLKYEQYASLAELQHDFLLTPAVDGSQAYETQLIRDELKAAGKGPFFHIGADETSELGDGKSRALVEARGKSQVYADHINAMARAVAPSGARIMLWDDGIQADPRITSLIPKNAVIVNWHYGAEKTFEPYIRVLARGGFDQMIAPGAHNWNNIFPDWDLAARNEELFLREGKAARVFGAFQTVWHDDGESLFEATWVPVVYSAANAWQSGTMGRAEFQREFAPAFFGVDDPQYALDVDRLASAQTFLTHGAYQGSDYYFWADPFDPRVRSALSTDDIHRARLEAEAVQKHLLREKPPLHANAAAVMFLAARRYDVLGRRYQIADEVRSYYDDARATQGKPGNHALRDLYWCKYWFWELRDNATELAPLYADAWNYENRPSHRESNLAKFARDASVAIDRAARIDNVTVEVFGRRQPLPPLEDVLNLPHA